MDLNGDDAGAPFLVAVRAAPALAIFSSSVTPSIASAAVLSGERCRCSSFAGLGRGAGGVLGDAPREPARGRRACHVKAIAIHDIVAIAIERYANKLLLTLALVDSGSIAPLSASQQEPLTCATSV